MSGSLRLRSIGTLIWPDIKYLPDLSHQHYDRLKKCGQGFLDCPRGFQTAKWYTHVYKKAHYHSSSYCMRFPWAGNEKHLFFLIWKFFPNLLKSCVIAISSEYFWADSARLAIKFSAISKYCETADSYVPTCYQYPRDHCDSACHG